MQSLILNIAGASLVLVGVIATFFSFLPRWPGDTEDSFMQVFCPMMALIGLGLYISSFFVG